MFRVRVRALATNSGAYYAAMTNRLEPGDAAPAFNLEDETGRRRSTDDYRGRGLVIYFYPRAGTPGCTTQSCDFRDNHAGFRRAGYEIVGISPDPVAKLADFKEEHQLPFPLLSDEDHAVAATYGAWGVKKNYGKEYEGLIRSTIVIGPDGHVQHAWYNVRAKGHVDRVTTELVS